MITYGRSRCVRAEDRRIYHGSSSIFMLLHPSERVVSGSSWINICCTEFCFRYSVHNWNMYQWNYFSRMVLYLPLHKTINQNFLPDSASSYSEACPLSELSPSIVCEGIWLTGLSTAASWIMLLFPLARDDLPPWKWFTSSEGKKKGIVCNFLQEQNRRCKTSIPTEPTTILFLQHLKQETGLKPKLRIYMKANQCWNKTCINLCFTIKLN